MSYQPAEQRYQHMSYPHCGNSGLKLPRISLGLWQHFGDNSTREQQRSLLRCAFDAGITHFDLANNYGTPYGSAEQNFGEVFRRDFRPFRDELIISTKAGYDMWPGPYGQGGSSRKYLLASLNQSLQRLSLEYVDIFYSHCYDPATPLEETASALASAVTQGKALYVGISSYPSAETGEIARLLQRWHIPLLVHQPAYNLFNRWVEDSLLETCARQGTGIIAFSTLAQGLLSGKYSASTPAALRRHSIDQRELSAENFARIAGLENIARQRGQSLPQMALAWVLRQPQISSALTGVSSPEQLLHNLGALQNIRFSEEELRDIDHFAIDGSSQFGRINDRQTEG